MSFTFRLQTYAKYVSIFLVCASMVFLMGLEMRLAGYLLLALAAVGALLADQKYLRDSTLIIIALFILTLTPINTDTSVSHMLWMGAALSAAIFVPYLVSRYVYRDYAVRFQFHHGRYWYRSEVAYVALAAVIAYVLLPFYLKNTGAYLNWPSLADTESLIRLFIGTNALGFWDELFFVSTVLGLLRRHFTFAFANVAQSVLFASFLFELGFTGWGAIMIFIFALLQGYIFKQTESLFYVISIHLTVDLVLFLALVNAHHPEMFAMFVS
jgi:membrane protease YdiL (CAAX protease family)